jgi:hypothetical protein
MDSPKLLTAEVLVTAEVPAKQEQAIVEAFLAIGVTARSRVVPTRRGVGELQWLVLAVLPLHAFLQGVGAKLAEGTYQGLARLIATVVGNRSGTSRSDRVMVLEDLTTRLQILLEADLPTDAYRQLVTLDLSAIQRGPLHYDRHRGRWRSELDEWHQRQAAPPP